jgi:hypothetical protein
MVPGGGGTGDMAAARAVREVQGWILIGAEQDSASMRMDTGWTSTQSGAGGSCNGDGGLRFHESEVRACLRPEVDGDRWISRSRLATASPGCHRECRWSMLMDGPRGQR